MFVDLEFKRPITSTTLMLVDMTEQCVYLQQNVCGQTMLITYFSTEGGTIYFEKQNRGSGGKTVKTRAAELRARFFSVHVFSTDERCIPDMIKHSLHAMQISCTETCCFCSRLSLTLIFSHERFFSMYRE